MSDDPEAQRERDNEYGHDTPAEPLRNNDIHSLDNKNIICRDDLEAYQDKPEDDLHTIGVVPRDLRDL